MLCTSKSATNQHDGRRAGLPGTDDGLIVKVTVKKKWCYISQAIEQKYYGTSGVMSNDHNTCDRNLKSEGGVTVSMDAFQAFDPGSTPGPRKSVLKCDLS